MLAISAFTAAKGIDHLVETLAKTLYFLSCRTTAEAVVGQMVRDGVVFLEQSGVFSLHPAVDQLFRAYIRYDDLLELIKGGESLVTHSRSQLTVALELVHGFEDRCAFCRRIAALAEELSPAELSLQAGTEIAISGSRPGHTWTVLLQRSGELFSGALGLSNGAKPS